MSFNDTSDDRRKRVFIKHKICRFCADSSLKIDYKDSKNLAAFTN